MTRKTFLRGFILALLLSMGMLLQVNAADLQLDAKGAILAEANSGQVLYESNADAKLFPASMTKIMTLLLAVEAVEQGKVKLTDTVRASEYACSFGGSQVWLEPGEEFTLEEILKAVSVGSANDASVALAEFIEGSEGRFVESMNRRAMELGAKNTNFVNPHGLHDDNHYTTPRDMMLIGQEAIKHPLILELTSIKEYTFREKPKLVLWNTNKLLWWYEGTDGLKTGTTSQAGRNLTSTVDKNNLRLVGVVMGVDKKQGHFSESMKLFDYGFARFGFKKFFEKGEIVASVPVGKGASEEVKVSAKQKIGAMVEKGQEDSLEVEVLLPDIVEAPVNKDQAIGEIRISKDGTEAGRFDLVAAEDIPKASLWQLWGRITNRAIGDDD